MAQSGNHRRGLLRALAVPVVALVTLGLGGCSSAHPSALAPGATVSITEKDFEISQPARSVPSGEVVLSVSNQGPDDHELIVVRADASSLPIRADGITVDEEALDPVTSGALEPGAPGSVRQLHLNLAPGHYALFCNMAGHYFGGMHAELDVT